MRGKIEGAAASINPPLRSGLSRRWVAGGLVGIAVVAALLAFDLRSLLIGALKGIEGLGPWAAVWFVVIYIGATVLFLPGSALTLGAGALFGVVHGSIIVSIASTLGATAAFLIGRYLAREFVARKVATNPSFAAIDHAVADEGWKIIGLTRLSPVFPFSLLNYAFGLTRVKFGEYVLASWLGMMPGTVMYVYLGSLVRVGTSGGRQRTPGEWALYGVGLVATIAVTVIITQIARRSLAKRTQSK
jgi:uncharacterized membrane protein YdjX (TVP38/TMEM64 family)